MAVFGNKPSPRKRTRNLDLESTTKRRRGGVLTVVSKKNFGATLIAVAFWAVQTLVVTAGAPGRTATDMGGVALLLLLAHLLFGWYVSLYNRAVLRDRRRLILVESITLMTVAAAKIFVVLRWPVVLLPLGVLSVAISVGLSRRLGAFWTCLAATLVGLVVGVERMGPVTIDLAAATTLGGGALVAIFSLDRISRRGKVVRAGIVSGAVYAVLIFVTYGLLNEQDSVWSLLRHNPKPLLQLMLMGFLNGLFTGYFLVEFGLRFVETAFDVVTDLRLQELSDLNQPILKRFAIEAPGTFHHSQMVGTLAEAAAEAIAANPLLCRVGAHFHDIGKMAKPEYFIENVRGGTKHTRLTPTMSTLIIIGHVKDGIEIAEELGLPSRVIDFIPEHHGTIAVEYFYQQARSQQEKEGGPDVSRDDFRYPGPRPRSKEAAILMIADSVEAISRVLDDPNPSRVESMIHDVTMRRLKEGQFDECGITMKELKEAEQAMVRVILAAHHGRIKYPKPSKEQLEPLGEVSGRIDLVKDLADGPGVPSAAALGPPSAQKLPPQAPAGDDGPEAAAFPPPSPPPLGRDAGDDDDDDDAAGRGAA